MINETPASRNRRAQVFQREGEYWTLVYDGMTCRLRDARGLRHLALLLARPDTEVAALALERRATECGGVPRDPDEAAEAVTDGVLHDARERARVNVTRAISAALKRIAAHHPALGRHLAATVKTGTFCTYTPDPRLPIEWQS
jgi:hypothetical protein